MPQLDAQDCGFDLEIRLRRDFTVGKGGNTGIVFFWPVFIPAECMPPSGGITANDRNHHPDPESSSRRGCDY